MTSLSQALKVATIVDFMQWIDRKNTKAMAHTTSPNEVGGVVRVLPFAKKEPFLIDRTLPSIYSTGCSNSICPKTNTYWAIKNALISQKNGICTFMRCGILTYDPWILLKITSLSSTASVLNDGRISLEIPSFCSEIYFFQNNGI